MIESVVFYLLAVLVIVPAILVVSLKNVFHSALMLILSLLGVAGLYAMLAADFLFAVQLLVYAGGIMVLLLFVILLSGTPADWSIPQVNDKALGAAFFSFLIIGMMGFAIFQWPFDDVRALPEPTTKLLGELLMGPMILPLEVVSLVMVVALIGAVYFSIKRPNS